jgi:hypothetical protein
MCYIDGQKNKYAQGESVFRLHNFNIVGFSTFILLRYTFRS